ncbi:ribonuclease HII [Azospira inquinata]|uniref:Ribonuclease HII n=1 Tax=Azospira inquinata TaxID=2785627 RepID=A0A975SMH8_9RHOO|nr:ribonuclease HII [Azospira inquinata]QWT45602.1 ribonuclease HII [Azospira inquinata]QWT49072.1 ribonuclease HII [Azospira inquinata]
MALQWFDGLICGLDEAGRGPLAGPVVAAAVILDPARPIVGLNDSKKLSAKKREALALEIKEKALAWGIGSASAAEIDAINILQASFLAMTRAYAQLAVPAEKALVDGNRCPKLPVATEAVVKGDGKIACIAAASILAKTSRDATMLALHQEYPEYGFDHHMAYPTAEHLAILERLGPTSDYRRSFGPVKRWLAAHGQG